MPYDPLTDPVASNYLATLAQQPALPAAPPVQQAAPPLKRTSWLEGLGQIGDAISRMYGHPGVYQTGLDEQRDREFEAQKQQMQLQQGQIELDDIAQKKVFLASRGLKSVYAKGGVPAVQAAWPKLAQLLGIPAEKAAQFGSMLQTDPEGTLQQLDAMVPQESQGSLPKEIQIYNLLKERDPAKAEEYLQAIAAGGQITPYQAEQIRLQEARIAQQGVLGRERVGVQREAIRSREGIARTRAAGGGGTGGVKMPAAVQSAYLANEDAIRQIDRAKSLVENRKQSVGAQFAVLPEIAAQRLDPDGTDARVAISNIGSLIIHQRTGATMAAAEAARLKPFIPSVSDTPETIGKKLDQLRKIAADNNASIKEYYQSQAPASAPASRRRSAAPTSNLPRVSSDADYAKLQPGQMFLDPNGQRRRKP